VPLTPRLLIDDMLSLKQAAIGGLGIVALPGYVCRDDVQSGVLRQVLPGWIADDSTLTALMPYRQGLLPSVRAFVEPVSTGARGRCQGFSPSYSLYPVLARQHGASWSSVPLDPDFALPPAPSLARRKTSPARTSPWTISILSMAMPSDSDTICV